MRLVPVERHALKPWVALGALAVALLASVGLWILGTREILSAAFSMNIAWVPSAIVIAFLVEAQKHARFRWAWREPGPRSAE